MNNLTLTPATASLYAETLREADITKFPAQGLDGIVHQPTTPAFEPK